MKTLDLSDIIPIAEYEKQRDARRKAAMELRARRLVQLGDKLALHFETRDTLIYQIQEMMRVENMTSVDAILEEIEIYGEMLPRDGTLSATLFIQLTNDTDLRKWLPVFTKLEGKLALNIGGESVQAEFEQGRTREDKTSSVHYIKFRLSEKQRTAMTKEPAEFVCTLKEYKQSSPVGEALRKELLADLT
ncbi:MAG: DUF3501 family protein [Planctomycetes bacterium]|nr:DUF3501 family protein [Planctomycetota bacterium]